jgi:hypothetical protein
MTMEYDPEMPESSYENIKDELENERRIHKAELEAAEAFNQAVKEENESQLDITGDGVTVVEFEVRDDGKVVWLNVNGITRTRICRITDFYITDNTRPKITPRGTCSLCEKLTWLPYETPNDPPFYPDKDGQRHCEDCEYWLLTGERIEDGT